MEQDDKVSAAALSLSSATGQARAPHALDRADAVEVPPSRLSSSGLDPEDERRPGSSSASKSEDEASSSDEAQAGGGKPGSVLPKKSNNVRRIRIERMMSKAELARRANLSVLTIDRVERGYGCRMDTKRKILEALGLSLADRVRVFGEEE
jgi:DNA-binding XRE family transcriptional regulator